MDLRGKYITTVRPTDNRLTDECLTTIHVPAGFLFNTQISISFIITQHQDTYTIQILHAQDI